METLNDKEKNKEFNAGENSNTFNPIEFKARTLSSDFHTGDFLNFLIRNMNYHYHYTTNGEAPDSLDLKEAYKIRTRDKEFIKELLIEGNDFLYQAFEMDIYNLITEEEHLELLKSLNDDELDRLADNFQEVRLDDEEIYKFEIRRNFNKANAFEQLWKDLKYYYTDDEEEIKKFANKEDSILKELIKDTDEQSYYNFDKFTKDEKDLLFDKINENNEADEEEQNKIDVRNDCKHIEEGFKLEKLVKSSKNKRAFEQ